MKTNINLSDQYTKFVDQPICSIYCPCPFKSAFKGTDKNLSQKNLIKWGRYCNTKASGGSNCIGYTATASNTKTDDLLQMQFVTATDTKTATYETYKDCYTKVLS